MTTCAIISDIHGNEEALRAVLLDIDKQKPKIKEIFCLGDIIGYGAKPSECISIIRERNITCVRGNHDDVIGNIRGITNYTDHARDSLEWTHNQISDLEREYLKSLPLSIAHNGFTLAHAQPIVPEDWSYIIGPGDAYDYVFWRLAAVEPKNLEVSFIGHVHSPAYYSMEKNLLRPKFEDVNANHAFGEFKIKLDPNSYHLINSGSVGQPRDNDPRAGYITYNPTKREVRFHRVEYDIIKARDQIIKAGLPELLGQRLEYGK